jgi:NADPH-dependent 2,4-dienoyl-CoA reductase/sulfur reductase-like enzyme
MTYHVELAVVGAGPAGMAAAWTAASAGVDVVLVESGAQLGGQYYKQLSPAFESHDRTAHQAEARRRLARLQASSVRLLGDTTVWGIFPASGAARWRLTLDGPDAPQALCARALVLATGAYDRPIAFPGWTLPGVMTAGAVQILIKHQRVLPGRRFLLSGTGPLQLALADHRVRAGADVMAVLEARRVGPRWLRHAPALWGQWKRLREGWTYGRTLLRARIPFRMGWSVLEARGDGEVEKAVIARVDDAGHPIFGTQQTLEVDTVVIGYGLLPNTMLSRMAGCEHARSSGGDLVPVRDAALQTTQPGIYAVGDNAGIGGAELAWLEGQWVGVHAAQALGYLDETDIEAPCASLRRRLARQRRFARALDALFTPGPGLYALAAEETVICRCEEVTLGEIRAAVSEGVASLNELKRLTRAGMGNCQGRTCGALLARALVESAPNLTLTSVGALPVRPPLHPLRLASLARKTVFTDT